MIKLGWKIYLMIAAILLLGGMVIFLEKFFFFLVIAAAALLVAIVLRFFKVLKYMGVELVTLSTMIIGVVHGPVIGGIYGFTILLAHLIIGDYYTGNYLMWAIPLYALLGVLSGIFGTSLIGFLGVSFIIGLDLISLFFTFIGESDRLGKELPYIIGNILINSILFVQFFGSVVNFVS